jgi:hypothetical protein
MLRMKKILVLLFSLFLLSSPSVFAEDISDFQIGGMSIGDSLLDYMSEDEILNEIELRKDYYLHLDQPYKYLEVYTFKDHPSYDAISFFIKNNSSNQYISNKNEKYIIQSIFGRKIFTEDFDNCIQKREEIEGKLSGMFSNSQKYEEIVKHPADSSGRSIVDAIYFELNSGAMIELSCLDYEETFRISKNWDDLLIVGIRSKKVRNWLNNQ